MITLQPRIDFGGQPFPSVVSTFDIPWLENFARQQEARLTTVTTTISEGGKLVDKARAEAVNAPSMTFGDRRPNGVVLKTAQDNIDEQRFRTHAARQVLQNVIEIRNRYTSQLVPTLKDMERASITAKTLAERVFDKYSCLWRASADMKLVDSIELRAQYATILAHSEPIELTKIAQRAIDDGSPASLILMDCVIRENFRRPRADRNFANTDLMNLVNVPEFNQAQPILKRVVDLHVQAMAAYQTFVNNTNRATQMKIASGLYSTKLAETSIPAQGDE